MDDLDPTYTDPDNYKTRPAEVHTGENIGTTDTHVVFVELKDLT